MNPNLDAWSKELGELPYPFQLRAIDRGISGEGFYPGARRCLFGDVAAPGVMLLGRDFGTLSYYSSLAAQRGHGEHALTWRHTRDIYIRALYGARVFCTNFLMGARVDGSAKGDLKDRVSADDWLFFEDACWRFLQRQLTDTRPDLIVVFGADNARDLGRNDRLGESSTRLLYAPHPHSAIGANNSERHRQVCRDINKRLGLTAS